MSGINTGEEDQVLVVQDSGVATECQVAVAGLRAHEAVDGDNAACVDLH